MSDTMIFLAHVFHFYLFMGFGVLALILAWRGKYAQGSYFLCWIILVTVLLKT